MMCAKVCLDDVMAVISSYGGGGGGGGRNSERMDEKISGIKTSASSRLHFDTASLISQLAISLMETGGTPSNRGRVLTNLEEETYGCSW
eukprot:15097655-Ditylum_brightwellii.AAC.1